MPRNLWTDEEIEYLEKSWGNKTIDVISKKLKRSKVAILTKVTRLGMSGVKLTGEFITAKEAGRMVGVDGKTIIRWINNHGLKAKQKKYIDRDFWSIKEKDLIEWLKSNQDKWDSRKMTLHSLGLEPGWLKEKRIKDRNKPLRRDWTTKEDMRLIALFKSNKYSATQIAQQLDRSRPSVEMRLKRLDMNTMKVDPIKVAKIKQGRKAG